MAEESYMVLDHIEDAPDADDFLFTNHVCRGSIPILQSQKAGEEMETVIAGHSKECSTHVANSLVRYARLLDQQESIFTKGKDFMALIRGLNSFRNVSKVTALVDFDPYYSDYNLPTGVEHDLYIKRHNWYSSRTCHEFGITVPPSKWCRWQDEELRDPEEDSKWDIRGVQNLLRALSLRCPRLRELRIASPDYHAPMTIFQLSDTDTEKVRTMFRRLTTIQFHLRVAKSDDSIEYAKQHHSLELLLQEAQQLRSLSSSGIFPEYEEEDSVDGNEDSVSSGLTDFCLLLGKTWFHLTELTLRGGEVKAKDLLSILRTHRGTLRDLNLQSIYLLGKEGWEHLGKDIGQVLKLHYVQTFLLSEDGDDVGDVAGLIHRWSSPDEKGLALVRDMMQWALPDLLEMENQHGRITGRLKAVL